MSNNAAFSKPSAQCQRRSKRWDAIVCSVEHQTSLCPPAVYVRNCADSTIQPCTNNLTAHTHTHTNITPNTYARQSSQAMSRKPMKQPSAAPKTEGWCTWSPRGITKMRCAHEGTTSENPQKIRSTRTHTPGSLARQRYCRFPPAAPNRVLACSVTLVTDRNSNLQTSEQAST